MKSWRYSQITFSGFLREVLKKGGNILLLFFLFPPFVNAQTEQTFPFSYYLVEKELQIISATKEVILYSSVPRYMRVITREQIDRWGAKNLFDLFRHLPEFYVRKSDFYLNAVGALGLRQSYFSEKVQVLIDGIPLADPSNGSSFSTNNNISLDNVKRVEIIYGPMTSLYGFNASLAVVNLITYSPEDIDVKVGTSLSTSGSSDSYLVGSFKKGGFEGIYSFVYREDKGPHEGYTDWIGTTRNISLFSKHFTYYLKLNHESGFYFKSYGVNRDDSFPLSISGFIVNGEHSFTDRTAYFNQFGFKRNKDAFFFDFHAYFNWFYLKRGYNLCPSTVSICSNYFAPDGLYAVEKRYVKNPGLSLFASYTSDYGKFSGGFDLSVAELYKTTIDANFLLSSTLFLSFEDVEKVPYSTLPASENLIDEVTRVTLSPYFQYLLAEDNYSFLFNVRVDRATDVGNALSYSLSALYKFNDNLSFKLNLGRAARVPSFEEMYIKNNPVLLGNRDLKFEKVDSVMPALEYTGDTTQLKLLFYFNWISDLIYKETVNDIQKRWTNADGSVKVRGMLLTLKKSLFNRYEVYFDVGRRFSYSGSVEKDYFQFPSWKGVTGVTYTGSGVELDVCTEFYSRISDDVGGYYLLNLSSRWNLRKDLTLTLELRNILDRNVYYPASWPKLVDEGRNLWLGLEYSF
ncbi:TonB-dependent receptor plug domain-containing protein [Phorcysia thermohydrogeniphila]|uniref:Iron complex outermembrane receptor protein n=1 Tax=Phorcysia thermohydrogeniphila TaxID=936138 RepID=A0A4R1GC59_9BACT|nr:TonB-dependent receptor [Phorcysia thermohydrogeniphila]TCK05418.1 iron complex outermembrane receptor protein [Phorcysia thermohydrogeniphila]